MGWLDWAIYDPAPGNCGYSFFNIPCEIERSLRYGQTIHSAWGRWPGGRRPSETMAQLGNSWGATILQDGTTYKHRPRPTFVNWHAGGPAQNIGTEAIEVEGYDEPWTPPQRASILRYCIDTWNWFGWGRVVLGHQTNRTQNGIREALVTVGRGSIWQHDWFDNTNCPMGRNDYDWLIPRLEAGIMSPIDLAKPILGMVANPKGGYWLYASDGGIFAFDAPFFGCAAEHNPAAPIVGMAATRSGKGYWQVGADGGIFCFGDAGFSGSVPELQGMATSGKKVHYSTLAKKK